MAAAARVTGLGEADFELIVREHQSMVFSIAYHFLHDRAVAEELSQDVFLRLFEGRDKLESPEHVKYWLRRAITNRCIDYSRRRRFMPRLGLDEIPEPSTPARLPDPLLGRLLRQLVASMPEKWRALIVLKFQEEMEIEEIAEMLGIPAGTVKSQLSRAMEFLRGKASRLVGEVK